jgi:hypothetical protein
VNELVAEATGRRARVNPTAPRTGGPAGNAQLTAWLGVLLLVLIAAELITLINVDGLISWHIVIGVLLVPPALVKTATTGWRILRFYSGNRPYRSAGPPPIILRLLGPLVVAATLAVLGSGLALISLGRRSTSHVFVTILGQQVSALTVHQATFIIWGTVTGLHIIGRIVPALRLSVAREGPMRIPGFGHRAGVFASTMVVAAVASILVLTASGPWTHHDHSARRPRVMSPGGVGGLAPGKHAKGE